MVIFLEGFFKILSGFCMFRKVQCFLNGDIGFVLKGMQIKKVLGWDYLFLFWIMIEFGRGDISFI